MQESTGGGYDPFMFRSEVQLLRVSMSSRHRFLSEIVGRESAVAGSFYPITKIVRIESVYAESPQTKVSRRDSFDRKRES